MKNCYLGRKRQCYMLKALLPPPQPCFVSMSTIAVHHNTSISYQMEKALQDVQNPQIRISHNYV